MRGRWLLLVAAMGCSCSKNSDPPSLTGGGTVGTSGGTSAGTGGTSAGTGGTSAGTGGTSAGTGGTSAGTGGAATQSGGTSAASGGLSGGAGGGAAGVEAMAGAGGVADCVVPADPPVAPKYADWDESSGFDVDAFLAEILVIDGNANYFTPGTEIGEPDFGADENGLSVKASTFIDVGCITLDADYYAREKTRLADGTYSGARLIERYADIELSRSQGEYGVVFYTQKHSPLAGSVANLGAWHTDGLRVFQLAYGSGTNETPEERLGGGSDQEGGLTALGAAVVEELLRLGIVVDLSHTNEQTTLEAAAVARERCVPVIANHAPAYALRVDDRYTRGKTDDEIVAVADTGGVVGVFTYGPWIERTEGMDADISDAVAHIDYMVSLVGVDHVGVATDGYLDGSWTPDADDNPQTSGDGLLDSPARYRYLAQALFDAGYSPLAIEKIFGLNFLRVYRAVWN